MTATALQVALEDRLGGDLGNVIASLPGAVAAYREITRFSGARHQKASFRLTLEDGRVLKLRLHRTPAGIAAYRALLPRLDGLPFPRCVLARGRLSVEQWVDGEPVAAVTPGDGLARAAGTLLAAVHARAPGAPLPASRPRGVDDYEALALRELGQLQQAGLLTPAAIGDLEAQLASCRPRRLVNGIVHGDFGLDNLVRDGSGALYVIDNESLQLGAPEYDLARAWVRWPRTPGIWAEFLAGYEVSRALPADRATGPFWGILALAETIAVHWRHGRPQADGLDLLRRIAKSRGPVRASTLTPW